MTHRIKNLKYLNFKRINPILIVSPHGYTKLKVIREKFNLYAILSNNYKT